MPIDEPQRQSMREAPNYVPSPMHSCPPVDPADVPILQQHLQHASKRLRALAVVVASTGRRADDVRQMRRQDVRLHERVWLYRPGRWLPLTPATCATIQALPDVGPWVFPLTWRQVNHPWSNRAVEKSWERFRQTLPGTLAHLTLTGLRASREQWIKHEEVVTDPSPEPAGVPFHVRMPLADLSALIERCQQTGNGEDTGLTVKELADLYFQYQLAGKSSYDLHRRTFYKELEFLLNRRVTSLKKIELLAWHASRRAAPAQANRGLGVLRAMANWAIGLDLLKGSNPTAGIRKFPMRSRERAVEPEEMPRLMWALSTAPPLHRTFFYLCLFTAARSGEVRRMEWQDVNLQSRIWFKPTTKNGRSHRVPLPQQAVDALAALPHEGRWVFPGLADHPLCAGTPRKWWETIRVVANLPDVTIHDLRRSAATWLASRNVNLSTVQHVLNHSSLQPTAIYARLHLSTLDSTLQQMADEMQQQALPALPKALIEGPMEPVTIV